MVLGCVLFFVQNLLAFSAATSLKKLLLRDVDCWESRLGIVLGFLAVVQVSVLGCGLAGILHIAGVLSVVGLMAGGLRYAASRIGAETPQPDRTLAVEERTPLATDPTPFWFELPRRLVDGFPLGTLVAVAIYWIYCHGFGPTRMVWDDYGYHLTFPYLWLKQARIFFDPLLLQSGFPFGGELPAMWIMLPFRLESQADVLAWVSLTGLVYGILGGLATVCIMQALNCSTNAAIVPIVLMLTSRAILWELDQFADVDFAMPVLIVAAIAFVMRLHHQRNFWGRLTYAAVGSGLALGTKLTALISCLVMLIMILWQALKVVRRERFPQVLAIPIGIWGTLSGYWYARNWLIYGNPVWPAKLAFFSGEDSIYKTSTLREYASRFGLSKAITDAFVAYANWPMSYAILAVSGFIAILVLWIRSRQLRSRSFAVWLMISWSILVLTLTLLPTQPWSAGNLYSFPSATVHVTSMRYITLIPILGWISLGAAIELFFDRNWRTILTAAICAYALYGLRVQTDSDVWIIVSIAMSFAVVLIPRFFGDLRWVASSEGVIIRICASIVCLVLLIAWHPVKRDSTRNVLFRPFDRDIGPEWACLNEFKHGIVAGHANVYVLFGDRFQFTPLLIGDVHNPADGTHFVSSIPAYDRMAPAEIERRLINEGTDLFVTFTYALNDRLLSSPLVDQFTRSGEFVPVCIGKSMTIWRARGLRPTTVNASPD